MRTFRELVLDNIEYIAKQCRCTVALSLSQSNIGTVVAYRSGTFDRVAWLEFDFQSDTKRVMLHGPGLDIAEGSWRFSPINSKEVGPMLADWRELLTRGW